MLALLYFGQEKLNFRTENKMSFVLNVLTQPQDSVQRFFKLIFKLQADFLTSRFEEC
jgi:hypothetical protein